MKKSLLENVSVKKKKRNKLNQKLTSESTRVQTKYGMFKRGLPTFYFLLDLGYSVNENLKLVYANAGEF